MIFRPFRDPLPGTGLFILCGAGLGLVVASRPIEYWQTGGQSNWLTQILRRLGESLGWDPP